MVIRERIISFGEDGSLFGIASFSADKERREPILIPNAGIVHRIGPHRLHVRLARALAEAGYPVLRFDLHGLGDSGPPSPEMGFEEQAISDISAAIDAMRTDSVTIIGLCSGADNAMRAAQGDRRIRRLVLLDPHAYGSARASASRLIEKAADPDRWWRAASRLMGGGGVDAVMRPGHEEGELEEAERLPIAKEEFAAQLDAVSKRGGRVLIRYTDFVRETLTSAAHFHAAFPEGRFGKFLTIDVDRETDHTYTALSAQQRLIARLSDWLESTDTARDKSA
ncbi:alpha/beta fold hydrolase [Parvularcula marina]|uniref:Alpha/beta fold hydrolase n=1 Tax=Parvularcula marina TaxID=2292771 RepID=A0A371RF31_9PROT|nr:alpha/beta fold hydrolase [Parvularcula marina]RFB04071.1 alpha/beta fold hydrolase [Parvularcula marina]